MNNILNCWQYMRCGREPGGKKAAELGVCPAATAVSHNGINSGKNGGRICWAVAGTLCGERVHCERATKEVSCMACKFFKKVKNEQGFYAFTLLMPSQMCRHPPCPPQDSRGMHAAGGR